MDRYFAQVLPADKADYVEKLQKEGRKVCFVGDGINDSIALKKANVSISLRGATSIATDTAHIVFMEEGLSKLCDLRDIARDLDRNVRRSWQLILAPNGLCIAGAFTLGFGVMTSVLTNNVAALAALANGMLPLRRIAEAQAQSQLEQDRRLAGALAGREEPVAITEVELLPEGAENNAAGVAVVELEVQDGDSEDEGQGVMVVELDPVPDSPSEPRLTTNGKGWPSGFGELLFERPLKRSLDDMLRGQVLDTANRRAPQLPFPVEFGMALGRPGAVGQIEPVADPGRLRFGKDGRLRQDVADHPHARDRCQPEAGDPPHRGDCR